MSNFIAVCGEQVAVLTFFTLLTLYANIIPISLYVSIEVIVFYVLVVLKTILKLCFLNIIYELYGFVKIGSVHYFGVVVSSYCISQFAMVVFCVSM